LQFFSQNILQFSFICKHMKIFFCHQAMKGEIKWGSNINQHHLWVSNNLFWKDGLEVEGWVENESHLPVIRLNYIGKGSIRLPRVPLRESEGKRRESGKDEGTNHLIQIIGFRLFALTRYFPSPALERSTLRVQSTRKNPSARTWKSFRLHFLPQVRNLPLKAEPSGARFKGTLIKLKQKKGWFFLNFDRKDRLLFL